MDVESIKNIRIKDFDYPLPDERIAKHPLKERDKCKLLVATPDACRHHHFSDLPELLPADSLLVCNDTKVINARIKFKKATGSTIEIFLLEPIAPEDYVLMFQTRGKCRWNCLVGNLKRWKSGSLEKTLDISEESVTLRATRYEALAGNAHEIEFEWDKDVTFASIVDAAGYIPIPPYLNRDSEQSDSEDYQTVYARERGSVAAPTAGLHFTQQVFDNLRERGIDIEKVTLHVGAGTFQPVKSEQIGEHPMHTETFSVSKNMLMTLSDALKKGRVVTAVGTTSVRTLESLPIIGKQLLAGDESLSVSQWEAYSDNCVQIPADKTETAKLIDTIIAYMDKHGIDDITCETSIMIAPGFKWRIVEHMVTNFHQPQSTLLLLVSSFLGKRADGAERWRIYYNEALSNDYRFLSYGDACLF